MPLKHAAHRFAAAGIAVLVTGTAAVLANAQPLLIVLPAWLLYRERVALRTAIALAVGFGGQLVVAVPGGGGGQGALSSLLAAVAVTAGTLMVLRLGDVDVFVASNSCSEELSSLLWPSSWKVRRRSTGRRFGAVLALLTLVGTAATTLAWFVKNQRRPLSSLTPWDVPGAPLRAGARHCGLVSHRGPPYRLAATRPTRGGRDLHAG